VASFNVDALHVGRGQQTAPGENCGVSGRERVAEIVESCVHANRVTVVSAPSGFGKTTEVEHWASKYSADAIWLTLGRFDSDVRSLDRHLLRVLQTHFPHDTFLDDSDLHEPARAYRAVCQYFETARRPLFLIIDDAHRALGAINDGIVGALIEDAPETLRMIVIGTTYLDLAFSRLLLYQPETKIDSKVLEFTESEIRDLIAASSSTLKPTEIYAHTQGWPIAVRLLAFTGAPPGEGATIQNVEISEQLGDYIERHVLATLSSETALHLLEMTVCEELTSQIAEAITGSPGAGRTLAECAQRGLFLTQRNCGSTVNYRWNTVFAHQCRLILQRTDPVKLAELHLRVAEVLEVDQPLHAVEHALSAGSAPRATDILLRHWLGLIVGNDAVAVERICAMFPNPHSDDPRVLLVRACAQEVMGEHALSRSLFARATNLLRYDHGLVGSNETLLLARLLLVDDRESSAQSSAEIRHLFETSETLTTVDRASLLYLVGWTELRHRSNPDLIEEYLAMAAREAQASHDQPLRRKALGQLVLAHAWAGHHQQAFQAADEAEQDVPKSVTPWDSYAGGGLLLGRGWVEYWSADADAAYESFLSVIKTDESRTTFGSSARMMLAAAAASSRNPRYCRRAASELHSITTEKTQEVRWGALKECGVAMLEEAAGHRKRAMAIAQSHVGTPELPFVTILLAAILRRGGDLSGAIRLLRSQPEYEETSYLSVTSRISLALLQAGNGKRELAHEWCEAALEVAAAENIRLPFCDGDLSVRQLLAAHVLRYPTHETFIADCLAFDRDEQSGNRLSEREHDVFVLMQTAMTLSEIAEDLQLSINTIKSHQRSIYQKLDVTSRREVRQVQL